MSAEHSRSKDTLESPVLIAGGGLIGLSAAMFLAQNGIPSLAVERLRGGSPLPRAAFFHMRTLEMFRSAGIEAEVRAQSEKEFMPEGALIIMDTLSGKKLADIIPSLNEGVDALSPCRRLFVTQPGLEPILRKRAKEAGAQVLEGLEVVGVEQDGNGVTVIAKDIDDGSERRFRGEYLIGADGAHSKVRELLGIDFEGRGVFSNSITIYFRADLSPQLGGKPLSVIYINNPMLGGFFRMDKDCQSGFLVVNTVGDPKKDPKAAANAAADVSEPRLIEFVRSGVGVPDLPVKIDGVARWRATSDVASKFRDGRVFLAGDAAHLMPPNGGFGGNTGIHDAHNLAWKLAAVLKGTAGPRLLETYETERRPVGKFTVEQAYTRYVTRTAPYLGATSSSAISITRRQSFPRTDRPSCTRIRARPSASPVRARRICGWSGEASAPRRSTCSAAHSCCWPDPRAAAGATLRVTRRCNFRRSGSTRIASAANTCAIWKAGSARRTGFIPRGRYWCVPTGSLPGAPGRCSAIRSAR
jgi:2-polyprenyl-6-methoxyphenol hydroxylase-like FAD-dependent oxidoreductase